MPVVSFSVLNPLASDCSIMTIHRSDHADADTAHLLSSKPNRDHLAKSIAQFKTGKAKCIAIINHKFHYGDH